MYFISQHAHDAWYMRNNVILRILNLEKFSGASLKSWNLISGEILLMAIIGIYFHFLGTTLEVDIPVQALNLAIQQLYLGVLLVIQVKAPNRVSTPLGILSIIVIIAGSVFILVISWYIPATVAFKWLLSYYFLRSADLFILQPIFGCYYQKVR